MYKANPCVLSFLSRLDIRDHVTVWSFLTNGFQPELWLTF